MLISKGISAKLRNHLVKHEEDGIEILRSEDVQGAPNTDASFYIPTEVKLYEEAVSYKSYCPHINVMLESIHSNYPSKKRKNIFTDDGGYVIVFEDEAEVAKAFGSNWKSRCEEEVPIYCPIPKSEDGDFNLYTKIVNNEFVISIFVFRPRNF